MLKFGIKFIFKTITWATCSRAKGAAALNHEALNDPMEIQIIVKILLRQVNKTENRNRRFIGEESQIDCALAGFDCCGDVQCDVLLYSLIDLLAGRSPFCARQGRVGEGEQFYRDYQSFHSNGLSSLAFDRV